MTPKSVLNMTLALMNDGFSDPFCCSTGVVRPCLLCCLRQAGMGDGFSRREALLTLRSVCGQPISYWLSSAARTEQDVADLLCKAIDSL